MSSNAFNIQGNTVCLSVTSTTHSTVQTIGSGPANINYVVTNVGASTAFIAFSAANLTGGPTVTVVAPTDGSPANGYPILAGSKETISAPPNAYWSAICASGQTATLYITPGEGV